MVDKNLEQRKENIQDLANKLASYVSMLQNGCGASGCVIRSLLGIKAKGIMVNGPCQCSPRNIAQSLKDIAATLESDYGYRFWIK